MLQFFTNGILRQLSSTPSFQLHPVSYFCGQIYGHHQEGRSGCQAGLGADNIVKTFTEALSRISIDQQVERESAKANLDELKGQLAHLQTLLEERGGSKKRRKIDLTGLLASPLIICIFTESVN
jgi:hypothetical protein